MTTFVSSEWDWLRAYCGRARRDKCCIECPVEGEACEECTAPQAEVEAQEHAKAIEGFILDELKNRITNGWVVPPGVKELMYAAIDEIDRTEREHDKKMGEIYTKLRETMGLEIDI